MKKLLLALVILVLCCNLQAQQKTSTSKGKALLMSAVYPGWGAAKLQSQPSLLLLGGICYASAGASYYYHTQAVKSYDLYLDNYDIIERGNLSSEWETNLRLSRTFLITAGAVWTADMIWVAMMRKKSGFSSYRPSNRPRIFSYYHPASKAPAIGLLYNF